RGSAPKSARKSAAVTHPPPRPPAQLVVQPAAREGPVAVGGAAAEAKGAGGLFQRQAGEEAEPDQFGAERVLPHQLLQRVVQREEVLRHFYAGQVDLVEAEAPLAAAPFEAALVAGAVDEDAAHGLGGRREEMP